MNLREEAVGSAAVSIEEHDKLKHNRINRVRIIAGKSVCKIHPAHREQGTGALYRVVDRQSRDRFLIMTCNHVLPTNAIYEIKQTQFFFPEIPQMGNVLEMAQVKFVWCAKLLDATVIEISPELAVRFQSYGANFLQVGEATPDVDVVILQFPAGTFSIAYGDIEAINGDKVFYQIGTEGGSSGSPLLNLDCVAVAMHNAGSAGAASTQPAGIRRATALSAVVKAYLKEQPEVDPEGAIATRPVPSFQHFSSGERAIELLISVL